MPFSVPPLIQGTRFGLEVTVLFGGNHKLDCARNGQINGLLIEGMGSHLQEQTQIVHLAFRDRQDVAAAGVVHGRAPGTLLVLSGNQSVAAIKCFRTAVAGREHAADFVYQEVPGDRLVRFRYSRASRTNSGMREGT